jgi:hypothetical protein
LIETLALTPALSPRRGGRLLTVMEDLERSTAATAAADIEMENVNKAETDNTRKRVGKGMA